VDGLLKEVIDESVDNLEGDLEKADKNLDEDPEDAIAEMLGDMFGLKKEDTEDMMKEMEEMVEEPPEMMEKMMEDPMGEMEEMYENKDGMMKDGAKMMRDPMSEMEKMLNDITEDEDDDDFDGGLKPGVKDDSCEDDPEGIIADDGTTCEVKMGQMAGVFGSYESACAWFDSDYNGNARYMWELCPSTCDKCYKEECTNDEDCDDDMICVCASENLRNRNLRRGIRFSKPVPGDVKCYCAE